MFNLLGVNIHIYGLLIGLGAWLAYEVSLKKTKSSGEKEELEKMLPWVLLGGVGGAGAYHVIDYWGRYYSHNPQKIFYLWEGGLGIWGGVLGGLLAVYFYCKIRKIGFFRITDLVVTGLPFAQAVGRLGNWVNGEIVGKNGEPLFAYEAFLNLTLGMILWRLEPKKDGQRLAIYLMGYGIIRILLENMRSEETIWKLFQVPVATLFGILSILSGIMLYRRKN